MEHPPGVGLLARDVRLERGGRTVLTGASLTVPPGLVTALVAPSGAGKSTLLRCLNRLLEPDAGAISLAGVDVRTIEPTLLRRRVGLVAQMPVMLPGSVRENVTYALADPPAGAVADAMEAAGLPAALADRDAAGLSGGERARVAMARAFARAPEVLLLDEPTAALDAGNAALIGATLRRLAARGIGVCLAIHDRALAAAIADRTVGLDDVELPAGPGARASSPRRPPDEAAP